MNQLYSNKIFLKEKLKTNKQKDEGPGKGPSFEA